MENSVNGLNRRLYRTEEKLIKMEHRSEENIQNEAQKGKKNANAKERLVS